MTRTYSDWAGRHEKKHLAELLEAVGNPSRYREAMHALGSDLGKQLMKEMPARGDVVLVCTVEDADFLARGLLEEIEGPAHRVSLVCFWNERKTIDKQELAPIVARYEEPYVASKVAAIVVVKSIISGACVVRTNLMELLDELHKAVPIFVAAPVLYKDAIASLEREFTRPVVKRMNHIWCASDDEKDGNTVKPGIGGTVYELLGLGNEKAKNRHRPSLLNARLARLTRE